MPRPLVLALLLVVASPACKRGSVESEPSETRSSTEAAAEVERVTDQDLLALTHLADVYDTGGLRVDFGTPARFKYTNGNWQSGWVDDRREGDATVSTFRSKAKVFLPSGERSPTRWRARVKPYAAGTLTVLLNGKKLTTAEVEPGGFRDLVAEKDRSLATNDPRHILFASDLSHRNNFCHWKLLPFQRTDALVWLRNPIIAVLGHIPLSGHHLAGLGRLVRASALLWMNVGISAGLGS